jgi:hypothetical protein
MIRRQVENPEQIEAVRPAGAMPAGNPLWEAVRLSAGFAGFGAGSVNLAISSSLLAGAGGPPGPLQLCAAAVAGLWGAGLLVLTVVCLARVRVPAGRGPRAVLILAAVLHVTAIALGPSQTSSLKLSQLAALLLTLMIIAALAWLQRFAGRSGQAGAADFTVPGPGRLLAAAFAGAVLVAGIATPGLAASTAGQYAVPHGSHGGSQQGSHHGR